MSSIVDKVLYAILAQNPPSNNFPYPSSFIIWPGIFNMFEYTSSLWEAALTKQTSKGCDIIVAAMTDINILLTLFLSSKNLELAKYYLWK